LVAQGLGTLGRLTGFAAARELMTKEKDVIF
jgi:hypothetical protein